MPLKFNKKEDIPALIWLIKFIAFYLLLSEVLWPWDVFRSEIVEPYTRVLAWELEHILKLIGVEVTRLQSTLIAESGTLRVRIIQQCTAFWGGYLVFFAVVTTLPASSFKARIFWLIAGTVLINAFNLLRLTVLLAVSFSDPDRFHPLHGLLSDLNVLAGGGVSLLTVHYLSLAPAGIRVFKGRSRKDPGKALGQQQGIETSVV